MSRTHKDRFYEAWCNYCWKEQNSWLVGESGQRKTLKQQTNIKMRRYKGDIPNGGTYKKMFYDVWNVD